MDAQRVRESLFYHLNIEPKGVALVPCCRPTVSLLYFVTTRKIYKNKIASFTPKKKISRNTNRPWCMYSKSLLWKRTFIVLGQKLNFEHMILIMHILLKRGPIMWILTHKSFFELFSKWIPFSSWYLTAMSWSVEENEICEARKVVERKVVSNKLINSRKCIQILIKNIKFKFKLLEIYRLAQKRIQFFKTFSTFLKSKSSQN